MSELAFQSKGQVDIHIYCPACLLLLHLSDVGSLRSRQIIHIIYRSILYMHKTNMSIVYSCTWGFVDLLFAIKGQYMTYTYHWTSTSSTDLWTIEYTRKSEVHGALCALLLWDGLSALNLDEDDCKQCNQGGQPDQEQPECHKKSVRQREGQQGGWEGSCQS